MVCIYCASPTAVINSRKQKRNNSIWRRRQCERCRAIFTSQEHADLGSALRVVRSGSPQLAPFSREMLFVHVYESCKHRQSAIGDAAALTQTIINQLLQISEHGAIARDDIVRHAHGVLANFDKAAATFYLAYHPLTIKDPGEKIRRAPQPR